MSLTHHRFYHHLCKAPFGHLEMKLFVLVMDFLIAWTQLEGKRPGNQFAQAAWLPGKRKSLNLNSLCLAAKSLQLCPTLCDPIDGSPPGSPVPGILQARTLEWVALSFSNA